MTQYQIEHYVSANGHHNLYMDWLSRLRDRQAKVAIIRRMNRFQQGNLGNHKFCRDGIWELRIDFGPGYRVYYALAGQRIVLLLCGGDKSTQDSDIDRAITFWRDWQRRNDNEKQSS